MIRKWGLDTGRSLLDPDDGVGTRWGRGLEEIALVFALGIALLNGVQILAVQLQERDLGFAALILVASAVSALILFGVCRLPCSGRAILLGGMLLSLALRLGYMLAVDTPAFSDFYQLLDAAEKLAQGDLSWTELDYFRNWGYQIPFVVYEALVLKLFSSTLALKILNLVFMLGSNFLIYKLARLFLREKVAAVVALLYALYPGAIHMVSVLTNQHIALFFLLLGLYLLLSRKSWPWMLLAGACLGVGNLMRPEGAVLWAALGCSALCVFCRWPGKKRAMQMALYLVLALAAYFAVNWGTGALLQAADIAPYGIGNNVPEWKFVVGLDATNEYGDYTEENLYILDIADDQERKDEAWQTIRQSFRESDDIPGFFLSKAKAMWAWDEGFTWSTGHLDREQTIAFGITAGTAIDRMIVLERGMYLLVWLCLGGAAVLLFLNPQQREKGVALVCLVAVCAFFCIYLLIEVQTRYRYSVMPFLFILAGIPPQSLLAFRRKHGDVAGDAVEKK